LKSALRICLIEDDSTLQNFIRFNLELEGYEVISYASGSTAFLELSSLLKCDLVILDNMLPGKNGIDLCNELRKVSKIPILFLSAKGTTHDRIEGLRAGANDYLPKPFDLEELLLRVFALLPKKQLSFKVGKISIDMDTLEAKDAQSRPIHQFSKKEIALLQLFLQNENKVLSRDEILDKIWGEDVYPTSRTIDNFILGFRKIFEPDQKNPIYFHSIRGVGYKFTNQKD
jgi:two-component system alkaline phosphatase synthesis response regulator PhoP